VTQIQSTVVFPVCETGANTLKKKIDVRKLMLTPQSGLEFLKILSWH
jgi:hypothetical protein